MVDQQTDQVQTSQKITLDQIEFRNFKTEEDLMTIISMIEKELSEPYPIYTYRYFVQKFPNHTFMAFYQGKCIGCIVSKLDEHVKNRERNHIKMRGYIAMLAVDPSFRRVGLGRKLIEIALQTMRAQHADEVVLEAEITNIAALRLYESFGFIRDKRLLTYYLNGNDAYKLKLFIES